jgi:hypothetical protein
MKNPINNIAIRDITQTNSTTFCVSFNILSGEDRIESIACGAAIDGYDYLTIVDPAGTTRTFEFDFGAIRKTISNNSTINCVLKIMDYDGEIWEEHFSKMLAIENNKCLIDNLLVFQRTDGSLLVDIYYDFISSYEADHALITFSVSNDNGETYIIPTTSALGDVGANVPTGSRRHIVWDAKTDYPNGISPIRVKIDAHSYRTATDVTAESGSIVLASQPEIPIITFISESEKETYGVEDGELFKELSIEFEPIESSSTSESST